MKKVIKKNFNSKFLFSCKENLEKHSQSFFMLQYLFFSGYFKIFNP